MTKSRPRIGKNLDKLFVNCNKLTEGTARRIISDNQLSNQKWTWDVPADLANISSSDCHRFHTFIGLGRWNSSNQKKRTLVIFIAERGNLTHLEPNIIKILSKSIREDKV
jgi:hypothetical protein